MARSRNRSTRAYEDEANRRSNAMVRRNRVPRIVSNGNVTRVTGSEMVVPTVGVVSTFEAYQLIINFMADGSNLTLAGTWLARQASLYNKYKITRATLRYVPSCSTATGGRIILAWNGDLNDTNPSNAQAASQYQNSVESPVWRQTSCNMMISRTPEYVVAPVEETGGTGIASPGSFIFAVDNGAGTTPVTGGSLYLDYDVSFWSRASFTDNT